MTGEPPFPQQPVGPPPGPFQQPPPGYQPPPPQGYQPPAPTAATPATAAAARDPLLPHLVWEGFLFLVALVLLVVLLATVPSAGRLMETLIVNTAVLGLLATGFAFSLRTGTPNLAAGSISAAAGMIFVAVGNASGNLVGMVVAVLVATVIGAVLGGIAGGLSVPGWAVTLGGGLVIEGVMLMASNGEPRSLRHFAQPTGALWFALFLIVSVGGGLLWYLLPRVRQPLSANRRSGDPGRWGGVAALLAALAGLGVSSLLAGLSGVLEAERIASTSVSDATTTMGIAIGAVLFGGVSVFGRRAGIAGTFLGVMVLATVETLMELHGLPASLFIVVAGIAVVVGLVVSRLLETVSGLFGRRPALPAPGLGPVPRSYSPK